MNNKFLILKSLIILFYVPVFSQQWFTYSTSNRLPVNDVRQIAVDEKNVKWIATGGGGLARFDDIRWTIYNSQTTDGNLKEDYLNCIALEGSVKWIGGKTGLYRFDDVNWQYFNSQNTSGGLPASGINCIAIEKDGTKWIGTNNGLSKFKGSWSCYTKATTQNALPSNKITAIAISSTGAKWVGTPAGLAMYDGGQWKAFTGVSVPALADGHVRKIVIDKKDHVWVATSSAGIVRYDGKNWESFNSTTVRSSEFSDHIRDLVLDTKDELWVLTLNGIMRAGKDSLRAQPESPVKGQWVQCASLDRQGKLWLGTDSAGIWKHDNAAWENYNAINSIPNDQIYSVNIDRENNLWLGTDGGGLVKFNGQEWKVFNQHNGLPDPHVQCVMMESGKNVYAGTHWSGFAKYDGTDWHIYNSSNCGLANDNVSSLSIDEAGSLWAGTSGGVFKFDGTTWSRFTGASTGGIITDDEVTCIAVEKKSTVVWAGTRSGLLKYDGAQWRNYGVGDGLASSDIRTITIDPNGVKWIGTSQGLTIYDNVKFINYSREDVSPELPEMVVRAISIDKENIKWIGTEQGIIRFDGKSWTVYNQQNTYNKLPGDMIYAIVVDKYNNKWIGTNNGLVKLVSSAARQPEMLKDSDSDGTPDRDDLCPSTFGAITNRGCPDLGKEEKAAVEQAFSNLLFESGQDVILKTSYSSLLELANTMKKNQSMRLYIEGHTDDQGDEKLNLELSKRRSEAVRSFLIEKGISADRIIAKGYGPFKPKTSNKDEVGRKVNRRVELYLVEGK